MSNDVIDGEIEGEKTDEERVVDRFMLGDTEDMDFHDRYYGDILRKEILRLRSAAFIRAQPEKAIGYREPAKQREPEPDSYEIEVLDLAWSPDHSQQTVEFRAIGAPNYSYSKVKDPILRAVVSLTVDTSKRLASGTGSALVRSDAAAAAQVFASPLGSDYTQAEGVPQEVPRERIVEACRAALRRHIAAALEENERASFRAKEQTSLIGQRIKVTT